MITRISNHFPTFILLPGVEITFKRKFFGPYFRTATVKKKPLTIKAILHTLSWLVKNPMLIAEGRPQRHAHPAINMTALFLVSPASIKIRVSSSIMEIREEKAAKERARKKRARKKEPPGIVENSLGIQIKVNPWLSAFITSSTF